jgi:tubulin polyglutamylase TTLL6/13
LQRINHFHGMLELCRKRSMARLLAGLAAAAPPGCGYDFFPATWQLPGQLGEFLAAARAGGKKATFIVKPDAGCQVGQRAGSARPYAHTYALPACMHELCGVSS